MIIFNNTVKLAKTIVNFRDESIITTVKRSIKYKNKTEFLRENTVFGMWREDSDL